MSNDEWEGPDGGDLNELDAETAHFEATHDGADWTDVAPEPCGVTGEDPDECDCPSHRASEADVRGFGYGTRVMWSHGRGVAGTVYPRDEWPYPDDLERHPGDIFVRWQDGTTTLVAPAALTRIGLGPGPVPYTAAEFSDPPPF